LRLNYNSPSRTMHIFRTPIVPAIAFLFGNARADPAVVIAAGIAAILLLGADHAFARGVGAFVVNLHDAVLPMDKNVQHDAARAVPRVRKAGRRC
jgi:hypothetical protein